MRFPEGGCGCPFEGQPRGAWGGVGSSNVKRFLYYFEGFPFGEVFFEHSNEFLTGPNVSGVYYTRTQLPVHMVSKGVGEAKMRQLYDLSAFTQLYPQVGLGEWCIPKRVLLLRTFRTGGLPFKTNTQKGISFLEEPYNTLLVLKWTEGTPFWMFPGKPERELASFWRTDRSLQLPICSHCTRASIAFENICKHMRHDTSWDTERKGNLQFGRTPIKFIQSWDCKKPWFSPSRETASSRCTGHRTVGHKLDWGGRCGRPVIKGRPSLFLGRRSDHAIGVNEETYDVLDQTINSLSSGPTSADVLKPVILQ